MSPPNNFYDKTIRTVFALGGAPKGEVGIEIEVEGTRLPGMFVDQTTGNIAAQMRYHWRTENDGSLRNLRPGDLSAEYVLREPVDRSALDKVLDYFTKKWEEAGATSYNSYRTSVHVHINVSDWTVRRVYSFLTAYFILEELLTEFADGGTKSRVANRFCLRLKDAEFISNQLQDALKRNMRGRFSEGNLKYGAVNIAALSKYGSLEFRALRGTTDTGLIKTWTKLLLAIKDYSEKFDYPHHIIQEFSERGPDEFIRRILGADADHLVGSTNYRDKLFDGMRLAQDVAFATNWEAPQAVKEEVVKKLDMYFTDFGQVNAEPVDDWVVPAPEPRIRGRIPPIPAGWGEVRAPAVRDTVRMQEQIAAIMRAGNAQYGRPI
jgi:hypothetical protein